MEMCRPIACCNVTVNLIQVDKRVNGRSTVGAFPSSGTVVLCNFGRTTLTDATMGTW